MSESLTANSQRVEALPVEWVNRLFMRLHGRFGNGFFDKFRIGQTDRDGNDIGVENAKQVWAEELAGLDNSGIAEHAAYLLEKMIIAEYHAVTVQLERMKRLGLTGKDRE